MSFSCQPFMIWMPPKAYSAGRCAMEHLQPRVINTDLAPTYASAIPALQRTGIIGRRCRHQPVQHLNNIIEQDHRAIKKRVNAKQGFMRRCT